MSTVIKKAGFVGWAALGLVAGPIKCGREVTSVTGKPYGASCAFDRPLSANYLQAAENSRIGPRLMHPVSF